MQSVSSRAAVCCLVSLLAWTPLTAADSAVLLPSKTNTLIQVTSASDQQLSNGLGDIYVGRTNQDGQGPATISIRRGLVAFDIAGSIPAGATIDDVTLTVDDVQGSNGNQPVSLCPMLRDWGQGTSYFSGGRGAPATNGDATWYYTFYNAGDPAASPAWSAPGGQPGVDFSAFVSATSISCTGSTNQSLSWAGTANPAMLTDVQQWLDSPATNFGWIILGNESAGQTAKRFGGQDAVAPESPPELTVQYSYTPWIWTGSAGKGAWTSGNWAAGSGIPGSLAQIVLGDAHATSGTLDLLSTALSVSQVTFAANKTMTITSTAPGGGQLTLENGSSPATVVVSGSGHAIDNTVAVTLDSDASITISGSSDSLSIAGDISDGSAAHGIIKDGLGTLILAGSDSYSGGTTIDAGTLCAVNSYALPGGTNLTVGAGGTFDFDPSLAAVPAALSATFAIAPVPEPGTLALLVAAMAILLPSVARARSPRAYDGAHAGRISNRSSATMTPFWARSPSSQPHCCAG